MTEPTEPTAIVPRGPVLSILDNATVFVKRPEDVEAAQKTLTEWVAQQLEGVRFELAQAEESLALATKRKWRTAGWKRQVKLWQGRVVYYEKIQRALHEGYFPMPDLPGVTQLFAVRTTQKHASEVAHNPYGWYSNQLSDIKARELPEGEGRFVDTQPFAREYTQEERYKDHSGEMKTRDRYYTKATGVDETIDFPVKAVRPQVLHEVDKALRDKIFDELGVILPGGGTTHRQGTGADPIVIGRIVRREGGVEKGCSFILHWWLDTKDL